MERYYIGYSSNSDDGEWLCTNASTLSSAKRAATRGYGDGYGDRTLKVAVVTRYDDQGNPDFEVVSRKERGTWIDA